MKPWYLKVSYQLYSDGKPGEQGTLEEWFASLNLYKRTITSPSYTASAITTSKESHFRTKGSQRPSYFLEQLERMVVHPAPRGREITLATPVFKGAAGTTTVDCIMLSRPLKEVTVTPIGLFPSYCYDHGADTLRVVIDLGSLVMTRDNLMTFDDRSVPADLTFTLNGKKVLTAHVDSLKNMPLTAEDLTPGPDMEPDETERVKIPFGELRASQIVNITPGLPLGTRSSIGTEPILMHAVIGTDGKIHLLRLDTTQDANLAGAAMSAVLRWTFAPPVKDGKVVEAETEIKFNFTGAGKSARGEENHLNSKH